MATLMPTITDAGLYRLITWLSPSFPVGGFSYSHGIEYAVEAGLVRDGDGLARWIEGIVAFGAGRVDAGLFRATWEAVAEEDEARLVWAAERGEALRGTAEAALESAQQGRAFVEALRQVWPGPNLERWLAALAAADRQPAYSVAVAMAASLAGVALRPALVAFLHALAANLVSAGVRLVPLGQTAGQRALAALEAPVLAAAEAALERPGDDLGAAALMVEWTSARHECQYTRLFRS